MKNPEQVDERRLSLLAAYILTKMGGAAHKLELMALLYLCERTSLESLETRLIGDEFMAGINGPFLACTKLWLDGEVNSTYWSKIIRSERNNQVSCLQEVSSIDDYFAPSEVALIDRVFNEFYGFELGYLIGHMKHSLPEYISPEYGHTALIDLKDVLAAVGKDSEKTAIIIAKFAAEDGIAKVMQGNVDFGD